MSSKDNKSVDFNPLDILASAAASLKQVDKTMTQLRSGSKEQSDIFPGESTKSKKSQDNNNGVKKIRVVTTLSSDLEKMLDEHNYGNSRKNAIEKSWPDGQSGSSDTKDRKVVVTVINKTGDHHVIRTLKTTDADSTECKQNNSNGQIDQADNTDHTQSVECSQESDTHSSEPSASNSEDASKCCCGVLSEVEGDFIDICEKCRDRRKKESYSDVESDGRICDKLGTNTNEDCGNVTLDVMSPQSSDTVCDNEVKSCPGNTADSPSNVCDKNNESRANIVRSLLTCEKEDVKCPDAILSLSKVESVDTDVGKEKEVTRCEPITESKGVESDSCRLIDKNNFFSGSEQEDDKSSAVKADSHLCQSSGDISTCVPEVNEFENENDKSSTEQAFTEKNCNDDLVKTTSQSNIVEKDSEDTETVQTLKTPEDNIASIDHCYAETTTIQGPQKHRKNMRLQSTESLLSDLSQDSGFAENSPGTPNYSKAEIQQRIGSPELKPATRVISTSPLLVSPSTSDDTCNKFSSLFEIGSSGISSLQDLNDVNKTRDAIIALVQSENFNNKKSAMSPVKSNPVTTNANLSPKIGKYRIGTFASVSNTNYGLESPKKNLAGDAQKQVRTSGSTSLLSKLNMVSSKSKTDDVVKPVETAFHVEHDHDYCLPAAAISSSPHLMAKLLKDTVFMKQGSVKPSHALPREKRSDSVSSDTTHKRPRKGSAASDINENSMDAPSPSSVVSDSPLSPSEVAASQSSMSTRQKVKAEKAAEYVRSGNSASKLKITGKFQDDYIYFLNTKVRSRRRTNSQDIPAPIPSDRILVPAPKPGDIVVPHLTDADLEAIKRGQHSGAKPPSSLNLVSTTPSHNASARILTSTPLQTTSNSVTNLSSPSTSVPSGSMTDEESKLINTILSMETGDSTVPSTSVVSELAGDMDTTVVTSTIPNNEGFGLNFIPEQLNLTSEQMEILYSAMDEVQSLSPDSTTNKFPPETEEGKTEKKEGLTDNTKSEEGPNQETSGEKDASISESDIEKKEEEEKDEKVDNVTPNSHLTVKSLLTDPAKPPTESKPVPPLTLLQNDTGNVKSLINSSVELPSGSVVNTIPDIPFTSLEKSSLDLFGNDLKLFPEASVPETTPTTSVPSISAASNDYNAPWIVTVSMYWNDLPAIMINNLPFVRLVDIHKQILPAKDTGILKKRCQLLGINVLNCSEMQRYFLVQYGKAFNSKSTLIVGKDDAKVLIGYYVNPVPKPHKTEEARTSEPEPKSCKTTKSSARAKSQSTEQRLCSAPATPELPAHVDQVEEPVLVTPCPSEVSQEVPAKITHIPSTAAPDRVQQTGQRISQRTRHKKINFLEMLKGDANNNTTCSGQGDLKVEDDEEEVLPPVDHVVTKEETNEVTEKVQKKSVKRKNSPVDKDLISKEKAAKQAKSKVEIEALDPVNTNRSSESETENKDLERFPLFVGKRGTKQGDREQMVKKLKTVKPKKPGSLKVKWTIFNKTNSKNPGILTGNDSHKNSGKSDSCKSEILAVIHKDIVSRNSDKRHMQAGNLFLDQYNGKDDACVRCCTCKKLFSVDMFLTHLHEIGGSGKLLVINQPQMIALRDMYPSENQKRMWQCFQKRRRALALENGEDAIKKIAITSEKNLLTGSAQHTGHKNNSAERVAKNPLARSRVPPITATTNRNNNVRISGRKRKQKQLYPIENYSFSKKVHAQQAHSISTNVQIESDGDEPMSPPTYDDSDSCCGSPTKMQRLCQEGISLEEGTASTSNVLPESVLTIANGPEVISFTALQHDEGLDV